MGTSAELLDPGRRAVVGSVLLLRQKGRSSVPLTQAWCPLLEGVCWTQLPLLLHGTLSPHNVFKRTLSFRVHVSKILRLIDLISRMALLGELL